MHALSTRSLPPDGFLVNRLCKVALRAPQILACDTVSNRSSNIGAHGQSHNCEPIASPNADSNDWFTNVCPDHEPNDRRSLTLPVCISDRGP